MKSTTCYTWIGITGGHFRILSERDGKITTIDERGLKHFGIKRSDLRECGCGRWRWPKHEKVKR